MTRAVTERGKQLARAFEGLKTTAYRCPADVWTLGYGHTLGIKEGMVCTTRQAELWLTEDMQRAARQVEGKIGTIVSELTDEQHDALCDFAFNLGVGPSGASEWKIWGKLRAREFDAIPAQLARFVYSGKPPVKLNGLVRRRAAEQVLWSENEPGSAEVETHSAETRVTDTPPAPADQPKRAGVITAIIGAVGAIPVAAQNILTAVAPWSAHSTMVQNSVAIVASVAAGAAVLLLALNWLQHERAKL